MLLAGSSQAENEEVFINYGAKGNSELLRCHGFVLDPNPADVYELYLLPPCVPRGPGEASRDAAPAPTSSHGSMPALPHNLPPDKASRRLALAAKAAPRSLLRHFLFAGGLPDLLLAGARVLCAQPGDELDKALAAATGGVHEQREGERGKLRS